MADFNPFTTTAVELQHLLEKGEITTIQIVERYLKQIDKFNHAGPCLNALVDVAPRNI